MTKIIRDIAVIGAGGVGGFFAGLILKSGKYRLSLVARGKHLEAIRKNGLTLKRNNGSVIKGSPFIATDDFRKLPAPDLAIIAVKGYDLDSVSQKLAEITEKDTVMLPLLNGVDIYERMRKRINNGIILPACVYISSHIVAPGLIEHIGGKGLIILGKDPKYPDFDETPILNVLENSGIEYQWQEDPFPAIWTKYVFIASFALVSAYSGKTLGEIRKNSVLNDTARRIAGEIVSLANARRIRLPQNIVEESLKKADSFPPETKTSYQRDLEIPGKPNEGDIFGGTIIRMGRELGIPTPVTESVYKDIKKKDG